MARRMIRYSDDRAAFVFGEHNAAQQGVSNLYTRSVYWQVTKPWMEKYDATIIRQAADDEVWTDLQRGYAAAHVQAYESWSITLPYKNGMAFDMDSNEGFVPKAGLCRIPIAVQEYLDAVEPIQQAWDKVAMVTNQVLTKFTRAAASYYYPQLGMLIKTGGGRVPDDMLARAEGMRRIGDLQNPLGPEPFREISGTLATAQLYPKVDVNGEAYNVWARKSPNVSMELFSKNCDHTSKATHRTYLNRRVFPIAEDN